MRKYIRVFADYPAQMMSVPSMPQKAKEICKAHGIKCRLGKDWLSSEISIEYKEEDKEKLGPCLVELMETLPLSFKPYWF